MHKARLTIILACLAWAATTPAADTQLCKWVDESGCVHYAEQCPPGVEAEQVEVAEAPYRNDDSGDSDTANVPKPQSAPAMEDAADRIAFESITNHRQLKGCWERILPPHNEGANPNKIEIYPFEEPDFQYFCFESSRKLFTYMTSRKPGGSPREIRKMATLMPSVERYSVPHKGIVLIEHLDSGSKLNWVTSVVKVTGLEEDYGLRTGDIYMTLRNVTTGEDVYARHLRKID